MPRKGQELLWRTCVLARSLPSREIEALRAALYGEVAISGVEPIVPRVVDRGGDVLHVAVAPAAFRHDTSKRPLIHSHMDACRGKGHL